MNEKLNKKMEWIKEAKAYMNDNPNETCCFIKGKDGLLFAVRVDKDIIRMFFTDTFEEITDINEFNEVLN